MSYLAPPIAHLTEIGIEEANRLLVAWGHRMGPCKRPMGYVWAHALMEDDQPVALCITASLIRETCAGLDRSQAIELARLCASRPDLNRVMLRMWRVFVLPRLARHHGWSWAVSYQDEALHTGNTYRLDGWKKIGRSHSGTDTRSGRKGRDKTIWGWQLQGAA